MAEERPNSFSNRTRLRKLQPRFWILINRSFNLKAWKQTKWFICLCQADCIIGNICLWNFSTLDGECSFQSEVTAVIAAENTVRCRFQGDDRGMDVTAEKVGCSEDGNAVLSLPYLCFSDQRQEYIQTIPCRGAEGQGELCALDALCLSGFSFAYAGVFHRLPRIMLYLPLVWIMNFCPAVSEPHLNAPSRLFEANELPAAPANIFKHRWRFFVTGRILRWL